MLATSLPPLSCADDRWPRGPRRPLYARWCRAGNTPILGSVVKLSPRISHLLLAAIALAAPQAGCLDARALPELPQPVADESPSSLGLCEIELPSARPCPSDVGGRLLPPMQPLPEPPVDTEDCEAAVDPTRMPRNVIVLMGDGVGPVHWQAARILKDAPLAVDAMEGPVLYATDSADPGVVTDSAASASAMATGHCTYNGQLGTSAAGLSVPTALELAQQAGKRTGLVTNTFLTDASPMAFAGHVPSRSCQTQISEAALDARPDVWLGGAVPASLFEALGGLDERADAAGYQVVTHWPPPASIRNRSPLLGLFSTGPSPTAWPQWEYGLTPEALRAPDNEEPTLAEMTRLALSHLAGSNRGEGFFLFVENEHPDTIGHDAIANPPLAAALMGPVMLELDKAVALVLEWVEANASFDDTLVVVCADHENGGYTFEGDTADDLLKARFPASPSHTSARVPIYALGPGSERLADVEHLTDIFHLLTGNLQALPSAPGCD